MKYYINFLRDKPIIRSLSLVNFIASFGAWFSTVAIYTMVVEFGSSEFAIAIVTAMHFIPAILIAPFSGSLIDRLRIKPLMVTLLFIELSMTACFLLIETSSQLWLLLIFIFLEFFESSWQKSDTLFGLVINNFNIFRKNIFFYFVFYKN